MPVIFITGHGDMPMAVQAVKKSALDSLEKHVADQVLLDEVRQALAKDAQLRRRLAGRTDRSGIPHKLMC